MQPQCFPLSFAAGCITHRAVSASQLARDTQDVNLGVNQQSAREDNDWLQPPDPHPPSPSPSSSFRTGEVRVEGHAAAWNTPGGDLGSLGSRRTTKQAECATAAPRTLSGD